MSFGSSVSSSHLAGTALDPEVARELNNIYLTKGVLGTTHIEGNTLSEENIRAIVDGSIPPSGSAYRHICASSAQGTSRPYCLPVMRYP